MITRIRNAYLVGKKQVTLPHTKLLESVAQVMVDNNYLTALNVEKTDRQPNLVLTLTYASGKPAISKIKRVSKPGVRIYSSASSLKPVLSGLGISILTTSKGVISNKDARKNNLGGEVLVELY